MFIYPDILARTIWGEARGDGVLGMEAVAHVIFNRYEVFKQNAGYWWGDSIENICTHPYQFSCWNASDPNYHKLILVTPDDPSFRVAMEIAEDAYEGVLGEDTTHGATHYYNSLVVSDIPKWAMGDLPTARIRNHVFHRPYEVPDLFVNRPKPNFLTLMWSYLFG